MKYKIINSSVFLQKKLTSYTLENEQERVEMRINKQQTRIEFLHPHIYLTGTSTKAVQYGHFIRSHETKKNCRQQLFGSE
jgi:hypothetical protein